MGSDERYADADLTELVQAAFDKYLLDRLPALLEKHTAVLDQWIMERICNASGRGYAPEFQAAVHKRVEEIVDNTVGNCMRVGKGRDIVDAKVLEYLDKKMEQHIEDQVRWRVNRLMERMKKDFEKTAQLAAEA
jgi:hypothetical protein